MENLLFSLNIVLPMALLLAMGYLFKRTGMFTDAFIRTGKKLCFYVLLSSSLFKNLYDSSLSALPYRFILFVVISILAEFLIAWLIAKKISGERNETGVIIQGAVRSNFAYIGIPLATMMFTDPDLLAQTSSETSLLSIFVIPLFNVFSVIALTVYGEKEGNTGIVSTTLRNILRNPCIISILAGLLVLLFRMAVPASAFFIRDHVGFLYKVLGYLAQMSTPLAFLLVGASLDFSHSVANIRKLSLIVALRTFLFPLAVLACAYLLHMATNVEYAILVSVFASPTAVASAIMAAETGGDSDLANEIVVYTTAFSIITLIIIIYSLKTMGCL